MTAVKKPSKRKKNDTYSADVEAAARVLRLESEGVAALLDVLDDGFTEALDLLAAVEGRIIVTGIGKSGHVARKIAATLASTGTPAQYVHPAEASHGDLGMVTGDDAVLAMSNSGETPELRDLFEYSRRYGIPLISITSKADSTVAEISDVALILPPVPEGCPMGLAPTTSTTMTLALGDALAVALLERKGFSAQDFRVLHPGGQLGSSLLRVAELMHTDDELPLAGEDVAMGEVLLVMTEKRFGCAGIIDGDGALIGVITDGDLRRYMYDGLLDRTAGEVMTRNPQTIRPLALAAEAVALMNERQITNLFAIDEGNGRPVGIVHIHDCLRAGIT